MYMLQGLYMDASFLMCLFEYTAQTFSEWWYFEKYYNVNDCQRRHVAFCSKHDHLSASRITMWTPSSSGLKHQEIAYSEMIVWYCAYIWSNSSPQMVV